MTYTAAAGAARHRFRWDYGRRLRLLANGGALMLADGGAFVAASLLFRAAYPIPANVLYYGRPLLPPGMALDTFGVIGLLFIAARFLSGDYGRRQLFWDEARGTTKALLIAGLADVVLVWAAGAHVPAINVAASWILLLFAVPLLRQVARWAMAHAGLWNIPTALLGSGDHVRETFEALSHSLSLGFAVRHIVLAGDEVPKGLGDLGKIVVGADTDIVKRLTDAGCREVVINTDDTLSQPLAETVQRLIAGNIGVAIVPSLRGLPLFGLSTNYFFGRDMLLLQVRNNLARIPSRLVKRWIDIVLSAALMVLLSPLFLAIIVAIWRDDGATPFFVQRRVGYRGCDFRCFKFRTMAPDAEQRLSAWQEANPALLDRYRQSNFKLPDDPRITRVGRWLRRTSLDELPQLLNVLVGDMSLVGPRPLLPREIRDYGPLDLYVLNRPGLTGLWQISGRSHTTFEDRVAYDAWYVRNWSLWYDTAILIQTLGVLIRGDGAY